MITSDVKSDALIRDITDYPISDISIQEMGDTDYQCNVYILPNFYMFHAILNVLP